MANANSISQPSKLTNHASGLHFDFIDEQERRGNPNSHLRTIVRSRVRRDAHSKRRALNTAHTRSTHIRRLERVLYPQISVELNELVDLGPVTRGPGHTSIVGVTFCPSPGSRQDDTREPPNLPQLARAVRPTTRTPHSSQNLLIQSNSGRNRVLRFRERQAGLPELSSKPNPQEGQLSTCSREFGRQYLSQGRISPQTMLGAGRIDPFDSFPVKMESYMHSLVNHYTSVCAYILPQEDNGVTSMHTKWVPLCMLNVMGFKSMLLAAEISLRGKSGLNPWWFRSIGVMGEIIELLSQELSKPKPDLSDTMVVAIINITCIELVWGEREKYRHHTKGLQQISRIRREENRRLSSFLEGMINWVHQLGGESVTSGIDDRNRFTAIPDHEDFTDNLPASHGSSPISREVVEILKSIRFLTTTHNALDAEFFKTISADYRATCKSIIHRLQSLYPKTTITSNLQDMCVLAACVYIDITLLRSPSSQYISQKELSQLQRALTEPNSFWEKKNNKDMFTWISGTANTVLADGDENPNRVLILVSHFDTMLRRLEGLSMG